MSRVPIAVITFMIGYNLWGLWLWRRAARFRKPGVSLYARLGLGLSVFRADNYTAEGQRARRQLVFAYAAGLPALLLWIWLWAAFA
jgi:hypothetical protein